MLAPSPLVVPLLITSASDTARTKVCCLLTARLRRVQGTERACEPCRCARWLPRVDSGQKVCCS